LKTAAGRLRKAAELRRAAHLANQHGQWRRAATLGRRNLRLESHPAAFHVIATVLAGRGEFAKATEFFHRTLTALREQPDSSLHVDTLLQLADLSAWRAWFDEAEKYLDQALCVAQETDTQEPNRSVARVLQNMALLYQITGRIADAKTVCDRLSTLAAKHSSDAACALRLRGELESALGHPRRAERLLHQSIELDRRLFGDTHAEVAAGLSALASHYESQSKLDRAETAYRQALDIAEKSSGPDSAEVAALLNNLAALAFRSGDGDTPADLYRRALHIKQRVFGRNHPEVAITLNNFGVLYKALGRLGEAKLLYQSAIQIFETSLGRAHPRTCDCLKNLAHLTAAESKEMLAGARRLEREFRDVTRLDNLLDPSAAQFRLEARRSPIHDVGIFACEDIPAGAHVIEYTGKLVPRRNLAARLVRNRTYCARLDLRTVIDGSTGGSGAQYVNHCCAPNLRPVRESGRLYLYSKRPIAAGEELSLDYNFSKYVETVPCHCGSPKCRGTINRK
jgi:tetratricopeptide (TPR) repeat protein